MSDVDPFPRPRATALEAEQRALLAAFPAATAVDARPLEVECCVVCHGRWWTGRYLPDAFGPRPRLIVCPACREEERR